MQEDYGRDQLSLLLVRKEVAGFGKKVVLVLMWESQEIHVRHRLPWYVLSCKSGIKLKYNQSISKRIWLSVDCMAYDPVFNIISVLW